MTANATKTFFDNNYSTTITTRFVHIVCVCVATHRIHRDALNSSSFQQVVLAQMSCENWCCKLFSFGMILGLESVEIRN